MACNSQVAAEVFTVRPALYGDESISRSSNEGAAVLEESVRVCACCPESFRLSAGTFALGYNDGGPVMVWSNWIATAVMNLAVAMCLAEISSAMPLAGGPYYW